MSDIGFIGLGIMGTPMALNLIRGGRRLFLHSRSGVPQELTAAGGKVARYQGDGVLAYFGYPAASEDDAERSITAGLELALGMETGGNAPEKLGVRVGIATGVVLVGDLLRSQAADNPPVVGGRRPYPSAGC